MLGWGLGVLVGVGGWSWDSCIPALLNAIELDKNAVRERAGPRTCACMYRTLELAIIAHFRCIYHYLQNWSGYPFLDGFSTGGRLFGGL